MNRRYAIKSLATSVGAMLTMPAWASSWSSATLGTMGNIGNEALLGELVETIIPTTTTMGAKGLGVQNFIQKMLADCFEKKAQDNFEKQLATIDPLSITAFGKPFAEGTSEKRVALLQSLSKSEDKDVQSFYRTLRGLTVQGYTSSEYYMTKFTDYEMAPARFYGCVPVKK